MHVTRNQFIAEIESRLPSEEARTGNSFYARGKRAQYNRQCRLMRRLDCGETPSQREISGYFGKGSTFSQI